MSSLPEPLITISPEYLSGAPVFTGTRVPVQALFDYIEGGDSKPAAVLTRGKVQGAGSARQLRTLEVGQNIRGHDVASVIDLGWADVTNGRLLDAMAANSIFWSPSTRASASNSGLLAVRLPSSCSVRRQTGSKTCCRWFRLEVEPGEIREITE